MSKRLDTALDDLRLSNERVKRWKKLAKRRGKEVEALNEIVDVMTKTLKVIAEFPNISYADGKFTLDRPYGQINLDTDQREILEAFDIIPNIFRPDEEADPNPHMVTGDPFVDSLRDTNQQQGAKQ